MPWPQFTWDPRVRQYKDARGKFVPRRVVRQALDEAIDAAREQLVSTTRLLQSGTLDIGSWQLRIEGLLKSIHVMSAAAAAGGWAQATAADWSVAANRIKAAYVQVEKLARRLEAGVYDVADGRLAGWMSGLGAWGSGTYENALRKRDLATGAVIAERRLIHSGSPCAPCLRYHALGWQPPRILPDIGTECLCQKFCRCTFERKTLGVSTIKFRPSQRAIDDDYVTVTVNIARLNAGWQRDRGFAIGPKGEGAIGGRLAGFREFLKSAIPKGTRVEQPVITVDDDGTVSFSDGRHRFAVLRDMGLKQMPVSVPPEQADLARRLFGPRKPKPKPRKPAPAAAAPRRMPTIIPPPRPIPPPTVPIPQVAVPRPPSREPMLPRPPVVIPPPPPPTWWQRAKQRTAAAARATLAKVRRFLVR